MLSQLLLLLAVLAACGALSAFVSARTRIPRAALLLLVGLVLGAIPVGHQLYDVSLLRPHLDLLGRLALVGVLFYGGLAVDLSEVRGALRPAFALATLGVLMTAFVIGAVLYGSGALHMITLPGLTFIIALTFGAVIAPNDPIAVFSLVETVRGGVRAETIARLESGLDDTIAATLLLLILLPLAQSGTFSSRDLVDAAGHFLWATLSAAAIGVLAGFLTAKVRARLSMDIFVEMAASVAVVAGVFLIAEEISSSGYVAVFIMGMAQARWRVKPRSAMEQAERDAGWQALFRAAEIFAFVTLGALVNISRLETVLVPALIVLAGIVLLARPLQVAVFTIGAGLQRREKLYLALIALKGVSPAILALAIVEELKRYSYLVDLTFAVTMGLMLTQTVMLSVLSRWGEKRDRIAPDPQASPTGVTG